MIGLCFFVLSLSTIGRADFPGLHILNTLRINEIINPAEVKLTGAVGKISNESGKDVVLFKTASQDIKIDLACLKDTDQSRIKSEKSTKEISAFVVNSKCILSRTDLPLGIRKDCSELPLSVENLDQMANQKGDQIDFLKSIPEGTLTGFTFITHSQSAQRGVDKKGLSKGEVDPMWPRVLRVSKDGKLTISYVCKPDNPSYGKIEVTYFDDKSNTIKTKEYDFSKGPGAGPEKRVSENPTSCLQCHATNSMHGVPSIKHNWPEYFFWSDSEPNRGIKMYGSSDDNMGPGYFRGRLASSKNKIPEGQSDAKDEANVNQEKIDFQAFRKLQKDNPCYATLPWPKIPAGKENDPAYKEYRYYPYAEEAQRQDSKKHMNYALRTNARITDMYSHLQAKRIWQLMKDEPSYDAAKFYLLMEAAQCLGTDDEKELKACAGVSVDRTRDDRVNYDRRSPQNSAPVLFSYGRAIGMADAQWSMEFKRPGDATYNAVMFKGTSEGGNDNAVHDVVAGEILKDIARTNPFIAKASENGLTRGVTEEFGEEFSCIDDLGGGLRNRLKGSSGAFCKVLHEQAKQNLEELKKKGGCKSAPASSTKEVKAENVQFSDPASIERGKLLASESGKGKCVNCHSPTDKNQRRYPREILFLEHSGLTADQKSMANRLMREKQLDNFPQTLKDRLIETADMPPGDSNLTAREREDIHNYIRSTIR